jgi:hypothetical protein
MASQEFTHNHFTNAICSGKGTVNEKVLGRIADATFNLQLFPPQITRPVHVHSLVCLFLCGGNPCQRQILTDYSALSRE